MEGSSGTAQGRSPLERLIDALEQHFEGEGFSRAVVVRAGMSSRRIRFEEPAYARWPAIVKEAIRQKKLDALVATAIKDAEAPELGGLLEDFKKSAEIDGLQPIQVPPWSRSLLALNLGLLIFNTMAAYVWFAAHLMPQMELLPSGGVTVVAILGVGLTVWKALADPDETKNALRKFLGEPRATKVLFAAIAVVAIAFAVTGTVYFSSSEPRVVLSVTRAGAGKQVVIDDEHRKAARTYFGFFEPIVLNIATETPRGYGPQTITLRRAWPLALSVPDPKFAKAFVLVRLIPLDHFLSLRGRAEPDPFYRLKVLIPNEPPHELRGLTFRAILLGGSRAELQAQARETRGHTRALVATLGVDDPAILSDWLDSPVYIETRALNIGEEITLELTCGDVKTNRTFTILEEVHDEFLKGVPR